MNLEKWGIAIFILLAIGLGVAGIYLITTVAHSDSNVLTGLIR